LKVNHQLESRMPEIGLFGSEGGAPTHGVPTLSSQSVWFALQSCSLSFSIFVEKVLGAMLTGMTTEQFQAEERKWLATAKDFVRVYSEEVRHPARAGGRQLG
jgi:hypothetical protein